MIESFKGVVDAINKTKLSKRSSQLDKTRSKPYWSTMVEMSARSFESFIIHKLGDQGQQNDYLANFKEVTEWINDTNGNIDVKNNYPYLLKDEVDTVHESFQQFFDTIQEEQNPDGSILVKEHIDIAYGSEEKHREAVETIVREQLDIQFKGIDSSDNKVSETTEGDDLPSDRGYYSIREIQQRTVLRDFQESGYLNYIGRLIKSPVDVADLYQVYRSPLIEKTHIILTKGGKIVGDAALTAGYISAAPTPSVDFIRTLMEAHGADQFYLLHNHPSGNPTPSTNDIQFTNEIADAFHDFFSGHIVINADKFFLIHSSNKKLPLKVTEYTYTPKDNLGQLFSNRFKIDGSQQHMAQVAEALLKRDGIRGAIIYLQSNLSISAYDAVTPDMNPIDVVKTATRGLNNNLGRNVIFVQEEGSFDITSEKLPPETLDVIQIGVAEGKTVVTAPDYGMNRLTVFQRKIGSSKRLWEQPYDYLFNIDGDNVSFKEKPALKRDFSDAAFLGQAVSEDPRLAASILSNQRREKKLGAVSQMVEEIKLSNPWLPNVNVYESMLDFRMKYGVEIEGANQIPGLFYRNQSHIIASHWMNGNKENIQKTIFHEVIGHEGLRGFVNEVAAKKGTDFRSELNSLLDQVYASFKDDVRLHDLIPLYTEGKKAGGKLTKEEQRLVAEEFIAQEAERGITNDIFEKIYAFLRKLYRTVFDSEFELDDIEIREILSASRDYIKRKGRYSKMPNALRNKTVYHGSGNDFDFFSSDFVGTGRKRTKFGWGLYFSTEKSAAGLYANLTSKRELIKRADATPTGLTIEDIETLLQDSSKKDLITTIENLKKPLIGKAKIEVGNKEKPVNKRNLSLL
jgi:hypothetical protein